MVMFLLVLGNNKTIDMKLNEKANAKSFSSATLIRQGTIEEILKLSGYFEAECYGADGKLKWKDKFRNTITTVGKNLALDTYLSGSGYSVTGPYIGLISLDSYGAGPAAGDTMASHAGWKEAGIAYTPTYTAPRKTAVFSAASGGSKTLTAVLEFTFTGSGTVKGAFLVFGTGATSTIDNTGGTLYSAGLLTAGDRAVIATDILRINYTASL
jgi:hypothetical protein